MSGINTNNFAPRPRYGDSILDCDKGLLKQERQRQAQEQRDHFKAAESDPGLMPKPQGFWSKAGDLAHSGARSLTCGMAAVGKHLPPISFDSEGRFSVTNSSGLTNRSDGTFGYTAPGSKTRYNSDGSFTYGGFNSDGSFNSR